MNRKQKYGQIRREAIACFWALVAIIVFWTIAGIGVSRLNITIFHTPLCGPLRDVSVPGFSPWLW